MNALKFISKCSLICTCTHIQKDIHILNKHEVPMYGGTFWGIFESTYIKCILMGITVHACAHIHTYTHSKDSNPEVLIESCKHVHSSSPFPSASFLYPGLYQ